MSLLIDVETVTVFRGDTDRKGNSVKEPAGTVDAVFAWGGVSRTMGEFDRQESAEHTPEVYVRQGADVRARDRLERANGERYSVVGNALWNQLGGVEVFGDVWKVFELESMNG